MEKFGTPIEKRRLFTYEERKAILKSSYGICAHCGKKLTTKTMTVEHIIPLSRGGTNEMENLTALCPACNEKKGNLLFLPYGFYTALRDKPRYDQMQNYVADWFATVSDQFDVERYPLIAPQFWQQIEIRSANSYRKKRGTRFISSFQLRWEFIGAGRIDEAEAVTGISVSEKHQALNRLCRQPSDHPVAFYILKNPATEKLLALAALCYQKESHTFALDLPWMDLAKTYQGPALKTILLYTLDIFESIYKKPVPCYAVLTPYQHAFQILENPDNGCLGKCAQFGEWVPDGEAGKQEDDSVYYMAQITRHDNQDVIEGIRQKISNHQHA